MLNFYAFYSTSKYINLFLLTTTSLFQVDASYSYYKFYERLLKQLKESFDDSNLKFVGAYFNVKPQTFERLVINDIIYGVIAVLLVLLLILAYTSDLFITVLVSLALMLSTGVAFFFYTVEVICS